jgi:hypothetical protein
MVSDTTVYAYPPSTQEAEVCSMASLGHIARAPSKKKKNMVYTKALPPSLLTQSNEERMKGLLYERTWLTSWVCLRGNTLRHNSLEVVTIQIHALAKVCT